MRCAIPLSRSWEKGVRVGDGDYIYEAYIPASESGTYGFNVRVIPTYPHLLQAHELRLIAWA